MTVPKDDTPRLHKKIERLSLQVSKLKKSELKLKQTRHLLQKKPMPLQKG